MSIKSIIKELILLGMGPTAWKCPFDAETWALNMGWKMSRGFKIDKLFIAHRQVFSKDGNPYFDWEEMNQQPFEVVSVHRVKGLKSTIFPLKRISEKFGTEYFSNTVCYMIAYALDKCTERVNGRLGLKENRPYKKFRLYGIDMLEKEELTIEKGGIEFWLGLSRGLGIECEIASGSAVMVTTSGSPYGFRVNKWKQIDPLGLLGKKSPSKREIIGVMDIHAPDFRKVTARELIQTL